jgi:hypothetical protein
MANEIHNYSIERFAFGDDDYYDIDWFDGSVYRTAKIKGSVIKAGILAGATDVNVYNSDGTLAGNRTITGANFEILFQTIGQFIVESHKNGVDGNVIFEVRSDPTNHSFIIRDHNTNVHIFACRNGAVEISDAYFLPTNTGTNGQVMTTDGAGNATWETPTTTDEFIPKISGFNLARYYKWANGSNTLYFSGLLSGGIGGTQTLILLGGATPTKVIRTRFVSGTGSGSIAGYRGSGTDFFIGMGFHAIFTFGHADTSFNSSAHNWVGLGNAITFQIGSLTYASSLGNIIGVGNDPSDTTLQILHNDSTGTATKIPLGLDFPSNRSIGASFTGMFCLELFNERQSTQIKWRITRIDTGTVEQGTITTNLPNGSTGLSPVVSRSNGSSTSLACTMDVAGIQIYTKY